MTTTIHFEFVPITPHYWRGSKSYRGWVDLFEILSANVKLFPLAYTQIATRGISSHYKREK